LAGLGALRAAVREARRRGATLHAVRVWPPPPRPGGVALQPWWSITTREAVNTVREAFAAAMGGFPRDLTVRVVTLIGPTGPALVEYADGDDDILVVGTSGRSWRRRLRLGGSITRYCVEHTGCPVLAIPPPAMARGGRVGALARAARRQFEQLSQAG
jgi:nucleotide-binding universal stress UspA family protein